MGDHCKGQGGRSNGRKMNKSDVKWSAYLKGRKWRREVLLRKRILNIHEFKSTRAALQSEILPNQHCTPIVKKQKSVRNFRYFQSARFLKLKSLDNIGNFIIN